VKIFVKKYVKKDSEESFISVAFSVASARLRADPPRSRGKLCDESTIPGA
jgi:hypothetical protein